jgi:hypothetical protein
MQIMLCLGNHVAIFQQLQPHLRLLLLLLLEVLMERLTGVMHLAGTNPSGSGQITLSSMPGAKVEVMVLSSVVNILAVVLIILVAADSRDGLVKLPSSHLVPACCGNLKSYC